MLCSAMAPKKVQQTCRANAPKKVRPAGLGLRAGSSTEFCVNGLRGRALAHKVKEKLDMSPCWLRDKGDKTASSHKKQEFIKELINCEDPSESGVFLKFYRTSSAISSNTL